MAECKRPQLPSLPPGYPCEHVSSSRASHTECQCFWRCPVSSCPMWFSSELNGKDHPERIHNFKEGQGYSFYDCLGQFGLEWFGRRSLFDQREATGQGLWMDLALARRSGQALHNSYTITNSPALAPLWKFFRTAVRNLTSAYENRAYTQAEGGTQPSICAQMRRDISQDSQGHIDSSDLDPTFDIPVV